MIQVSKPHLGPDELAAVGLPELIAMSFEEYEAMAARLAHHRELLLSLRQKLETNLKQCQLYDGRAFAIKVEKAYQMMREIYFSGQPPRPFRIELQDGE